MVVRINPSAHLISNLIMKIYTSFFGNAKKLNKNGIAIVGIALFPPKWLSIPSYKPCAPTYDIFKNSKDKEDYTNRYTKEVLYMLDVNTMMNYLKNVSGGRDVALCCFEKPEEFCHRHLLAKFLEERLGIEVKEFDEEQMVNKCSQLSLNL